MCNEMKRKKLITHERVEILTNDLLAAFVRNREKYAFLIIRPESTAGTEAQGPECCKLSRPRRSQLGGKIIPEL